MIIGLKNYIIILKSFNLKNLSSDHYLCGLIINICDQPIYYH